MHDVMQPIWRLLLSGLAVLCGPACAQFAPDAGSLQQAAALSEGYRSAARNDRACVPEQSLHHGIAVLQTGGGWHDQKAGLAPKAAEEPFSEGESGVLSQPVAGLALLRAARERSADLPRKDGNIGGARATGRVAGVYLKIGAGVFLSFDLVPQTRRKSAERWAEVQFPDLQANGAGSAMAFISDSQSGIGVGDIVEIKIAHKGSMETMRYFPALGITRVTELVAGRDDVLAQRYAQRILSRTARTLPGPGN